MERCQRTVGKYVGLCEASWQNPGMRRGRTVQKALLWQAALERLALGATCPSPLVALKPTRPSDTEGNLSRQIVALREEVASLREELRELSKDRSLEGRIQDLCDAYVREVSELDTVTEVLRVPRGGGWLIWTLMEAPPFEESLRYPVYEVQYRVLSAVEESLPVDFYLLNTSELGESAELEDVVPAGAQPLWRRNSA